MLIYKYRKNDGLFLSGTSHQPAFDAATEGLQAFPNHLRPDKRLERFSATAPDHKRPATTQEILAFDTERADRGANQTFDDQKLIKAVAIFAATKLAIPLAQAKQEILGIYKGL